MIRPRRLFPKLESVLTDPDQLKLFPTVLYVYPIFYDKKEVKKITSYKRI